MNYFRQNSYDGLLLSEPYTRKTAVGRPPTVRQPSDLLLFQNSGDDRSKTCIFWKPDSGAVFGLPQFTTSNLTTIELRLDQRKMVIASAYVEPSMDSHNTINAIGNLLRSYNGSYICLGMDANGKHESWGCSESNSRGHEIFNLFNACDMVVFNEGNEPTFESRNHKKHVQSIIDVTAISENMTDKVTDWTVNRDACPSSDHNAISFTISCPELYVPTHRDTTYLFNNKTADWIEFRRTLKELYQGSELPSWTEERIPKHKIDDVVCKLDNIITSACHSSMKLRGTNKKHNPFWTDKLEKQKIEVIKLHHKLQREVKTNSSVDTIAALAEELSVAKKLYAKDIGKASKENFREFCNKQGKEDVWSLTNRIIKDAPRKTPPTMLKLATGFTEDTQQAADALINHFYPDDELDLTPEHAALREEMTVISDGQDEPPFVQAEIREALDSMHPDRAPGVDHFTSDIISAVFDELPTLTVNIMNSCLADGHFPDAWKIAQVRILQKPGKDDYTNLSSYRPIGLLPVMGKLLEKLFVRRLTYRAQSDGTWSDRQFGFKEQKSTVTALHTLISRIEEAKRDKKQVLGVSLDIKGAFDNAWWPALMCGLRRSQCPKNIHKLIQDYFRRRTVRLLFGDSMSVKTVSKGCIQGSVCGPTFWNIILDGLLNSSLPDGCYIQAYADDVMLLVTGRNRDSVEQKANEALNIILNWGHEVKLTFSAPKTFGISFSSQTKNLKIEMDGSPVTMTKEIKLLGVIIDSRLTFINHSKYVIGKVTRTFKNLCKFVRPTWGVCSANVETIYHRVIEPTITYAAGIWGKAVKYKCVRRRLRTFQRSFAIRAIKGFHTVSAVSALALAQFMPLHLKLEEVMKIEKVKLTGKFHLVQEDDGLESKIHPSELIHPAERKGITYARVGTQEEADDIDSDVKIFTDGSKLESGKTGAAMVIYRNDRQLENVRPVRQDRQVRQDRKPEVRKYKLSDHCTVYQAEMYAIYEAVKWAANRGRNKTTTIFSDSRSSLDALTDRSHNSELGNEIFKTLNSVTGTTEIRFAWIKAHIGIIGNETADEAAKKATEKHAAESYSSFPISFAKYHIRTEQWDKWRHEYRTSEQGAMTRLFFPTLDDAKEFRSTTELSFELTQVLTGHSYAKEYLKRFRIIGEESCPCDNDTQQSLIHLLMSCPKYGAYRRQLFYTCQEKDVNPMDLSEVMRAKHLMESFCNFISRIINTLKDFNCT